MREEIERTQRLAAAQRIRVRQEEIRAEAISPRTG